MSTVGGADERTVEWRDGFGTWAAIPKAEIVSAAATGSSGRFSVRAETSADTDDVAVEWRDGLGNWATP